MASKLPTEFVKPPGARPAPRRRGGKKTSLLDPEAARALLREVIVRLGEAEHRALEEARAELGRSGEQVTLEQMVHRIIADWTARRAEASKPAARPVEGILAQIRRMARSPVQTWRELGDAVRRLTGLVADVAGSPSSPR
jgi:hypothetical protein